MKKVISVFISIIMVCTMIPAAELSAYAEEKQDTDYLTFTAQENNSYVAFSAASCDSIMYSTNGEDWQNYTDNTQIDLENVGDKVQFKGKNVITDSDHHFNMHGKIAASGSVTSLTDEKGTDESINLTSGCYYGMFKGCSALVEAPKLPSLNLDEYCYQYMFKECSNLKTAPELPATKMKDACYQGMFEYCSSLENISELPAMELAELCYAEMFSNCGALTVLPDLPATKMVQGCYNNMFQACFKLNLYETGVGKAWKLPQGIDAETACLSTMLNNSKFGKAPEPGKTYYFKEYPEVEITQQPSESNNNTVIAKADPEGNIEYQWYKVLTNNISLTSENINCNMGALNGDSVDSVYIRFVNSYAVNVDCEGATGNYTFDISDEDYEKLSEYTKEMITKKEGNTYEYKNTDAVQLSLSGSGEFTVSNIEAEADTFEIMSGYTSNCLTGAAAGTYICRCKAKGFDQIIVSSDKVTVKETSKEKKCKETKCWKNPFFGCWSVAKKSTCKDASKGHKTLEVTKYCKSSCNSNKPGIHFISWFR